MSFTSKYNCVSYHSVCRFPFGCIQNQYNYHVISVPNSKKCWKHAPAEKDKKGKKKVKKVKKVTSDDYHDGTETNHK